MHNTIDERKKKPRAASGSSRALLATLLCLLLLHGIGQTGFAQQQKAIEPCPTTPTATRTGQLKVASSPNEARANVTETLVDETISDDPALKRMLEPYSAKVRELDVLIGTLRGTLLKQGIGGGSLGNFVADALRAQASRKVGKSVPLMVTNAGGLRRNGISEGQLHVRDIFELLPFENVLIQIDLTGEQVLKLLALVLRSRDVQSGARIRYRMNQQDKLEFVSATLVDLQGREKPIDAKAIYSIVTIDYLYGLSSGGYLMLHEGKNMKPLGITMRDAMLEYVKSETTAGRVVRANLDGRFVLIGENPAREKAPE